MKLAKKVKAVMTVRPKAKVEALIAGRQVRMRVDQLRVHPTVQKQIIPSMLQKIIDNLDLDAVGVLHAVEYTTQFEGQPLKAVWVIDGQHRLTALKHHDLGEWEVEVKIHDAVKTDADAARVFRLLSTRAATPAFDSFRLACVEGDPVTVGVQEIVTALGLEVSRYKKDGHVNCVTVLRRLYRIEQGRVLRCALGSLVEAFGATADAVDGRLVAALGLIVRRNKTLDKKRLVQKLAEHATGPRGLISGARAATRSHGGSISVNLAAGIVDLYNYKRGKDTRIV